MAPNSVLLVLCLLGCGALAVPKTGRLGANADPELHNPEEYVVKPTYDEDVDQDTIVNDFEEGRNRVYFQAATSVSPFPSDIPSAPLACGWKRIGYLDMTDPTQQCFDAWKKYSSPRAACGRKSASGGCDSVLLPASGYSYQTVCGRFRGYQVGTPDGFDGKGRGIEGPYVDGISLTYGAAGARNHVFTYAVGWSETSSAPNPCPCATGPAPPAFVGSNYHCESGNPGPTYSYGIMYSQDPLWDGQQCGGGEGSCCSTQNLAWFCTQLSAPVSSDLEVRICMDEDIGNEDVAIEYLEVYVK